VLLFFSRIENLFPNSIKLMILLCELPINFQKKVQSGFNQLISIRFVINHPYQFLVAMFRFLPKAY